MTLSFAGHNHKWNTVEDGKLTYNILLKIYIFKLRLIAKPLFILLLASASNFLSGSRFFYILNYNRLCRKNYS